MKKIEPNWGLASILIAAVGVWTAIYFGVIKTVNMWIENEWLTEILNNL